MAKEVEALDRMPDFTTGQGDERARLAMIGDGAQLPASPPDCREPANLVGRTIGSPIGTLTLVASRVGIVAVLWPKERPGRVPLGPIREGTSDHLDGAHAQLDAYFAGRLRRFDLPRPPTTPAPSRRRRAPAPRRRGMPAAKSRRPYDPEP